MSVVVMSQREAIGYAYDVIGLRIETEFWFRDPVFSGLHGISDIADGRSYRDTEHCCYPWHIDGPASRRLVTVVLPVLTSVDVVVHELGHAFHYWNGFEFDPAPVSWYAETSPGEAFAEAFASHLLPGYEAGIPDAESREWFEAQGLVGWRNV